MNRTDLISRIDEMQARIDGAKAKAEARPNDKAAVRWNRIVNDPMVTHLRDLLVVMGDGEYQGDVIALQREIDGCGIEEMLDKFQSFTR